MAAMEINSDNFEEAVLKSDKPVLIDFWAVWCGPCGMMSPLVDEIADDEKDRLTVGKINCDENMELAQRYGVSGIPAFLLFKEGEVVEKVMGAMPKGELLAAVKKHL
ncbi:MAG: thioredoxin [Roseburia sp.]|nr:thioredoxin [Roseburia sp.]